MKFVVSSTELLNHLTAISRVISSKSTLPILDNFLFRLEENKLTVTASDLETTLITWIDLDNTEGIGEIAAKGPNVMKGYYNAPEATAAVFRDGWLLTGDLGKIDADGYITITGRKKSLIVNREGKNIYPEEVEHQICKSPFIREALALGYREDGEKVGEHVGVIVVPNQEEIDALQKKHHRPMNEQEVADLIRKEIKRLSSEIAEYKRPRRIQIRWEEFSKTSTGKVKRYLYSMGGELS